MTCNVLVLFTNDSEKAAKELVSHFDNVSINAICMDSLANAANFRPGAKAKINVMFFSPQLLKFLENKPLDAFHICSQLDTSSTLAVFCCGLKERNVLCYHMAPLKSFSSWCKFEISDKEFVDNNRVVFPLELLSRIHEVLAEDDQEAVEVIVVPQCLNRHRNIIYLIFTCPIKKPEDVKLSLKDPNEIDISLELVNPYVMRFSVPESLFQYSHNVKVTVQAKDRIIANPMVHLSQDTSSSFQSNGERSTSLYHPRLTTKEELLLDEHLKFLTSFSSENHDTLTKPHKLRDADEPSVIVVSQEVITDVETMYMDPGLSESTNNPVKLHSTEDHDLYNLCKRYGLEQLSFLISTEALFVNDSKTLHIESNVEEETEKYNSLLQEAVPGNECKLPDMDSSNRIDSYLNEETDLYRLRSTRRSLSLPSTLIPSVDRDSCDHYLDMSGIERRDLKPHERLLRKLKNPSTVSSERSRERTKRSSYQREAFSSVTSGSANYVSLLLDSDPEKDFHTLLKKDLSPSQQELLDIMQEFKDGDCTISSVENEFKLWRERHCTAETRRDTFRKAAQSEKKRKISVFPLPWKNNGQRKTKKKSTVQNGAVSPHESSAPPRKTSNTRLSSASSKTSDASVTKRYSRYDGNTITELVTEDTATTGTGWITSYSPSPPRPCPLYPERDPPPRPHCPLYPERYPPPRPHCPLYPERDPPPRPCCPLYPERDPPPLPTRPPPSPKVSTPLKPMPLPRKNVPSVNPVNSDDAKESKNEGSFSAFTNKTGRDDNSNRNIVDLCQKYGLENLGNCFVSGMQKEMVPDSGKQSSTSVQDSEEDSLEAYLRENIDRTHGGVFRRSASLPSDLQKYDSLNEMKNATEERSKLYDFEHCSSIQSSITSNVYMTLFELHKGSLGEESTNVPKVNLSDSQEELLELIYAFKRGDKTMSQVQHQFQEWHARNIGVPPINVKDSRKQSTFKLPTLKRLIQGKPRKKSYTEKNLENDVDITRNKNSVTSNSSQKRLSKISFTSNSSMNSECNDVFKSNKESGKEDEVSGSSTSSVRSTVTKPSPPPLPPRNTCSVRNDISVETPSQNNSSANEAISSTINDAKKFKPIPPPKPKKLFKSNSPVESEEHLWKISFKPADPESTSAETTSPPSSPDYIIPNIHIPPQVGRKKQSNSRQATKKANSVQHSNSVTPSRQGTLRCESETGRKNMNKQASTCSGVAQENVPSVATPEPLPAHTLKFLLMANLLSPVPENASRFYIRRSSSYPSLRVSDTPTYLELLRTASRVYRRSTLQLDGTAIPTSETDGQQQE